MGRLKNRYDVGAEPSPPNFDSVIFVRENLSAPPSIPHCSLKSKFVMFHFETFPKLALWG